MKLSLNTLILSPLIALFLFSGLHFGPVLAPHKAEAAPPRNIVKTVLSKPTKQNLKQNTTSATANKSLTFKEFTLDQIAFSISKIVIKQLTQSMIDWINSGFKGNPGFVQNFGNFMGNAANNASGNFINNGLSGLCSPFSLNVKSALDQSVNKPIANLSSCSLGNSGADLTKFANNDFSAGWSAFRDIGTQIGNNPFSAFFAARDAHNKAVGDSLTAAARDDRNGRGFLSQTDESGNTITPGSVIEQQLNHLLGSGVRQLELSDELNEIISTLLSQLLSQIQGGGLFGLSKGGSDGSPSFTSQLGSETAPETESIAESAIRRINEQIVEEEAYKREYESALSSIVLTESFAAQNSSCFSNSATLQIIQDRKFEVADEINDSESNINILKELIQQLLDATTPQEQQQILDVFLNLTADGTFRGPLEVFDAEDAREAIQSEMSSINSQISQAIIACNAAQNPGNNNNDPAQNNDVGTGR